jgi:phospholipase C
MSGIKANQTEPQPRPNSPIEHLVVVMQHNHSFDNYFGTYPGAEGIPAGTCIPVDPGEPDNPACIEPYHIGDSSIEDLDHSTHIFLRQYNEGQMDGFVHALNRRNQDGSIAMGYYDDRDIPYYWNLADEYVLFDHFFSSAHGGSVWNRMFWVAGVPGNEENQIPPGGYGDIPTIFDRLHKKGISWKFYIRNYDPQINYRILEEGGFLYPQVQWVPLLSIDRFIDDPELSSRIVDFEVFYEDLERGTLPSVSYVLALGATEHPLSSLEAGQQFVRVMLQSLMASDAWSNSAFMITYDDWGGWYDHVPPPQVDEYGYGFRVPALLVSPYAKKGFIDSTELDFTSILKFIEENWSLEPLAERDKNANNILNAFDFDRPPRDPHFISIERSIEQGSEEPNRPVIYLIYSSAIFVSGMIILWAAFNNQINRLRGTSMKGRSQKQRG